MKEWIKTALYLMEKLPGVCRRIDKKIDALSVSLKVETLVLVKALLGLEDIKRRLCNLKVLALGILGSLCVVDRRIVKLYFTGYSGEEIAIKESLSKSTVHRKIRKAIERGVGYCEELGYNEDKFLEDYGEMGFIMKVKGRYSSVEN